MRVVVTTYAKPNKNFCKFLKRESRSDQKVEKQLESVLILTWIQSSGAVVELLCEIGPFAIDKKTIKAQLGLLSKSHRVNWHQMLRDSPLGMKDTTGITLSFYKLI